MTKKPKNLILHPSDEQRIKEIFPEFSCDENVSSFTQSINQGRINGTINFIIKSLKEGHPMNRCIRNEK